MKKILAAFLCLTLIPVVPAYAEEDPAAAAETLLQDVKGTYDELFDTITVPEYDQLWLDNCAAVLGEEMAPDAAEMLKTVCNADIYGQEAMRMRWNSTTRNRPPFHFLLKKHLHFAESML